MFDDNAESSLRTAVCKMSVLINALHLDVILTGVYRKNSHKFMLEYWKRNDKSFNWTTNSYISDVSGHLGENKFDVSQEEN